MAEVRLKKVCKSFAGTAVLQDVDLTISDGGFWVFLGPSGCGKSTLLRLIAGLEAVTSGSIHIGGRDVTDLAPQKRNLAMVFQSYALYPHMNVYQNMAFGLKRAGRRRDEIAARVHAAARTLHIEHLLERKPAELSGGQRQRVAIGRAIVREPGVFLFDEPLSNLDADLRVRMRFEFNRLHRELKATMIYVTHDQVEAMTLAEQLVVIDTGRIAQTGPPLELYHHPRSLFVARFLGAPRMNLIEARLEGGGRAGARVRLPGGLQVQVAVDATRARSGDAVTLGVRPEHLTLEPVAGAAIEGEVGLVERLGDHALIYLHWHPRAEPIIMRMPGGTAVGTGQRLHLGLHPQVCHLFDARGIAFPRTGFQEPVREMQPQRQSESS